MTFLLMILYLSVHPTLSENKLLKLTLKIPSLKTSTRTLLIEKQNQLKKVKALYARFAILSLKKVISLAFSVDTLSVSTVKLTTLELKSRMVRR